MVENKRNVPLTDFTFESDDEILDGLKAIVKWRGISIEEAILDSLAAGMMIKAANYAGYDVVGRYPDGKKVIITKASDRDKL